MHFTSFLMSKKTEFQSPLEKNLHVIWKNERHFEGGVLDELFGKNKIKHIAYTDIFLVSHLPAHGLTRI